MRQSPPLCVFICMISLIMLHIISCSFMLECICLDQRCIALNQIYTRSGHLDTVYACLNSLICIFDNLLAKHIFQDEVLRKAVHSFKGKNWKKIGKFHNLTYFTDALV